MVDMRENKQEMKISIKDRRQLAFKFRVKLRSFVVISDVCVHA